MPGQRRRVGNGRARGGGNGNDKKTDGFKKGMWAGQSKFLVVVRVRPLNAKEAATSENRVKVMDGRVVVVQDPAADSKDILRANRAQDRRYAFDHAFDGNISTEEVFEHTTKFLIDGVVNGFNATVFAYGATGAGKTFTMLGTETRPGLMVLTLEDLFRKIAAESEAQSTEFKVSLSYIEVYNEMIRDLLTPQSDVLELREDPIKGPTVAGVTELVMNNTKEIMVQLRKGNKMRSQEATGANAESSRSHAVLQIIVEQRDKGGKDKKVGKLSMVDLAGSERAANTSNRGLRLKEGANINRSLLALGNCINALTSGNKGSYIPYRDSKLTRMLKDSLGGNCRTVMIAACSPAAASFDETVNTLKYANRAKKIKTTVTRNVLNVNYHISQYEDLIRNLRSEIANLKKKVGTGDAGAGAGAGAGASLGATSRGEHESQTLAALRNDLVENFKERMQLRRSLIDLQAQNLQNNLEIQRRQQALSTLEDQGLAESPEGEAARQDIEELTRSSAKNDLVNLGIQTRLKDNEHKAGLIRKELHSRITSEERKELLNLEYRIGLLELDNMELEHSRLLHEQVVRQRDMRVEQLEAMVVARDKVIDELKAHLQAAGLGHLVNTEMLERLAGENVQQPPMMDFVPKRHKGARPPFTPGVHASQMPSGTSVLAGGGFAPAAGAGAGAGAGVDAMVVGTGIELTIDPHAHAHGKQQHSPIETPRKGKARRGHSNSFDDDSGAMDIGPGRHGGHAGGDHRAPASEIRTDDARGRARGRGGRRGRNAPRSPIFPSPHPPVAAAWTDEAGSPSGGGGGGAGNGVGHSLSLPSLPAQPEPVARQRHPASHNPPGMYRPQQQQHHAAAQRQAQKQQHQVQQPRLMGQRSMDDGLGSEEGHSGGGGGGGDRRYGGYAARARGRGQPRRLRAYNSNSNQSYAADDSSAADGDDESVPTSITARSSGHAERSPARHASNEPFWHQNSGNGSNSNSGGYSKPRRQRAAMVPRRAMPGGRNRRVTGKTNARVRRYNRDARVRARGSSMSGAAGADQRNRHRGGGGGGGGGGYARGQAAAAVVLDDEDMHPSAASVLSRLNARMSNIHPANSPVLSNNPNVSSGSEDELSIVGRNGRQVAPVGMMGDGHHSGPEADSDREHQQHRGGGPAGSPQSVPHWRNKFDKPSAPPSRLPYLPDQRSPI